MPAIAMSKRSVDTAKAIDGKRTNYFDKTLAGFVLRVTPTGAKTFAVKYRAGTGRKAPVRWHTIGRYGPLTVEQARAEAKRILGSVAHGKDPASEKQELANQSSVATVIDEWLAKDQKDNRTVNDVERIMRRDIVPVIGSKAIGAVTKLDIIRLVDAIAERAPIMANRTLAHTKRLFRWAASRDIISADPSQFVERPATDRKRDRVLGDDELVAVWNAAIGIGGPYGAGVRLLILTGARREEIFRARWSELAGDSSALILPPERDKVGAGRVIPLVQAATAVIEELPRLGDYLLTSNGRSPFSGFSKSKARLDLHCGVANWRLHDLRRTVATGLQRLGVRLEVTETVLGHVAGSRSGVVGVYQRHKYENEAREALAVWADHLQLMMKGR